MQEEGSNGSSVLSGNGQQASMPGTHSIKTKGCDRMSLHLHFQRVAPLTAVESAFNGLSWFVLKRSQSIGTIVYPASAKGALGLCASLLVKLWRTSFKTRLLFGKQGRYLEAPGIATSNKKLLGAPGLTTRSKDATRGSWHRY